MTIKIECRDCDTTGLYQGFAEPPGVGPTGNSITYNQFKNGALP